MASRSERLVAPLVDAVAAGAYRLLRPSFIDQARSLIEKVGPHRFLTARRLIAIRLLTVLAGVVLGFVLGRGSSSDMRLFYLLVTPLLSWHIPTVYLQRIARTRADEITRDLPDILDQVTISVGAGLGFEAAIARVCQGSRSPLAGELSRTLQDIRVGVERTVAYGALSRRVDSEDLTAVATSVVQSIELGTPLGPVLRARATELRRKRRARADEMAQKLSVKLTLPTAFCILPSIMVVVIGPTVVNVLENGFGA